MVIPELVNAPQGYVWAWHKKQFAHLIADAHPFSGLSTTLCGKKVRGANHIVAFQVGGYSACPCQDCLRSER